MANKNKRGHVSRTNKRDAWREAISRANTKLTPEVVRSLKDAFAIGATVKEACYYAEVGESTYYKWTSENPVLLEEFELMRRRLPLAAKTNIATAIQNAKDLFHSRWLLERTDPDTYAESLKVKTKTEGTLDEDLINDFEEKMYERIRSRIKTKSTQKHEQEPGSEK